jgi:hypothetical protein
MDYVFHLCLLSKVDDGQATVDHCLSSNKKIPSSTSGTKGCLRGTTRNYVFKLERQTFKPANVSFMAITGLPVTGYFYSPVKSPKRATGEFGLIRERHSRSMPVLGFHLTFPTR